MDKEFLIGLEGSKLFRLLWMFVVPLILFNLPATILAQQSQEIPINWLELCENPLVDALVSEPCLTLTSPDGFTLTKEGERVLGCLWGGTLAIMAGIPELATMGELVGCGEQSSLTTDSNTLSTIPNRIETNESMVWNSFTDAGLFSIQVPQYWNYVPVDVYSKLGPIQYGFNYYDELGEVAGVMLLINNSGNYSNSLGLAKLLLSTLEDEENATILEPLYCNLYTLNDVGACSFSVVSETESSTATNYFVVALVNPKGIENIAMFISSSSMYDRFLPIGKQIIDSIKIDSSKVSAVLGIEESFDLQSELNVLPNNQTNGTVFSTPQNQTSSNNQPPGFEISEF